jgi:hypothetical protein
MPGGRWTRVVLPCASPEDGGRAARTWVEENVPAVSTTPMQPAN